MLNLLPKGIIINNIVDTLKKDPENGVVKLLETSKSHAKTADNEAFLAQIIDYYATSATAKMQVRNLVYNTSKRTLYTFAEKIYDAIASPPSAFNFSPKGTSSTNHLAVMELSFMRMMTIAEAAKLKSGMPIFPVIDLKNLNDASKKVLADLKNSGLIFFASIVITAENFATVTSDEVILTLIKHGIRAIFYRTSTTDSAFEVQILEKINQIRTQRPILAFLMKKSAPNSKSLVYVISENVNGKEYVVRLNLR